MSELDVVVIFYLKSNLYRSTIKLKCSRLTNQTVSCTVYSWDGIILSQFDCIMLLLHIQ